MNPRLTLNIELSSKSDRTGRWSVMVRLHLKGYKPGRVLTSVKIEQAPKCWAALDPKRAIKPEWGKWVIRHPDKESINERIRSEHDRIKQQIESWQKAEPGLLFTPDMLADRFRSASVSENYYQQMLPILEESKSQAYTTWRGKRTALNAFVAFAGQDTLTVNVTPKLVRQFQQHLLKRRIGRTGEPLKGSTVNTYLDSLHNLHKQLLITSGVSPKQALLQSPWNDRERAGEIKPKKMRLDEAAIERVSRVSVETNRRKMTPDLAFHIWMLSHVLAGARFSDVLQLRYTNFQVDANGQPTQLRYEMMKTGFVINIPLFDEARLLLSRFWQVGRCGSTEYVLPFLSRKEAYARILTHEQYKRSPFATRAKLSQHIGHWNYQVNVCLREIQAEAGLSGLTTHTSRHSFADLARRIMQEDKTLTLYDIQLMLGHLEYKTTVGYMEELSGQDASRPMQAVFNRNKNRSAQAKPEDPEPLN